MRGRDNYRPDLEAEALKLLAVVGHERGALTHHNVGRLARHLGFEIIHVGDLPHSTRSVTDLENGRIYLPPASIPGGHGLRALALQAMAHRVLGHREPPSYAEFLQQRLDINYFAAACLMPETSSVEFLSSAKSRRDLAIEDFRDAFGVTHEAAALRFTNLATKHLGLQVHFLRVGDDGGIYKAYENDGLPLPTDVSGSVEGQLVPRGLGGTHRVRTDQSDDGVLPDHRYAERHVLVLRPDRHDALRGVLDHGRGSLRGLEVVPGSRDAGALPIGRARRVGPAGGRRALRAMEGQGLADRPSCTRTSCRRCPQEPFRASTTWRCTASSRPTPTRTPDAFLRSARGQRGAQRNALRVIGRECGPEGRASGRMGMACGTRPMDEDRVHG